jgi:hypothetical protein
VFHACVAVTGVLMVGVMLSASTGVASAAAADGSKQEKKRQDTSCNNTDDRPLIHLSNHVQLRRTESKNERE